MNQWQAKEFSKLTHVSVRTLHYYDKIGLLKPSFRLPNGYRLYSEADLLKLQQIIALKFFGFQLSQIKMLLAAKVNIFEHFSMQSQFLQEKAKKLSQASDILNEIISSCSNKESIPWKNVIELIEVYQMTQQLENSWVSKVLNPEELKQYALFEKGLKSRYSPNEKAIFEKKWSALVSEIKKNLDQNPDSILGIQIGKRCMEMTKNLYGKEHANLRKKIWEEGFKKSKNEQAHGLSPEMVAWLDKAVGAYWRQRIYGVLAQVGINSSEDILALWNQLLEDMYGDMEEPKQEMLTAVMQDEAISKAAKDWLKNTLKS